MRAVLSSAQDSVVSRRVTTSSPQKGDRDQVSVLCIDAPSVACYWSGSCILHTSIAGVRIRSFRPPHEHEHPTQDNCVCLSQIWTRRLIYAVPIWISEAPENSHATKLSYLVLSHGRSASLPSSLALAVYPSLAFACSTRLAALL
jgi:hypothetical protein